MAHTTIATHRFNYVAFSPIQWLLLLDRAYRESRQLRPHKINI